MNALQAWLIDLFHRKIFATLGSEISNRIYLASSDFFKKTYGPQLLNRFFDVFAFQKFATTLLTDSFSFILQFIVGLTLIAFYHPMFLLFNILLIVSLLISFFIFFKSAIYSAIDESKAKYSFVHWLQEQGRALNILNAEKYQKSTFSKTNTLINNYLLKRKKHFSFLQTQNILLGLIFAFSSSILLGLGGYLVNQNQLSLGQLVAAEIIVTGILINLSKADKYLESFYDLMASSEKILHLFQIEGSNSNTKNLLDNKTLHIQFKDVGIAMPKKSFTFNQSIEAHKTYCFKMYQNSCMHLILDKLLNKNSNVLGHISINGIPIEDISEQELRSHIYVIDPNNIIEDSLKNNLTLGNENIETELIYKALEVVDLKNTILNYPNKLETKVLANGNPLWPNQRVRLDIAIAILSEAKVLVLTESFLTLGIDRQKCILDYLCSNKRSWSLLHFTTHIYKPSNYDWITPLQWNAQ